MYGNKNIFLVLSLSILILLFNNNSNCAEKQLFPVLRLASWYSIASLKKEGTYKYSKGRMANGKLFNENDYTCAIRGYPFGAKLKVTNLENGLSVEVMVTDRISKRFAQTRIDLSKLAFSKLDKLEKGIIRVKIEIIK